MSRLVVLPGGGGHVSQVRPTARQQARTAGHPSIYDYAAEPERVFVALSPLEWSLIHQALVERGTGSSLRPGSQAHADLAAKVRAMVRGRVSADDCPPLGYPRPGGVS